MPELPEVETTRAGLAPLITNQVVNQVILHRADLRWEMPKHLNNTLSGHPIHQVRRRGKYLLIEFEVGTLILHLGMSGSIKVLNQTEPLVKHDHFEMQLTNGQSLRLNDPRRFGAVLFSEDGAHPLLNSLGVEPLEDEFDDHYLYQQSRNKQQNIKGFVMDSKVVVGVGNIYACESLFKAGINPKTKASRVSLQRYQKLTQVIRQTLLAAIEAGGTTLQDFAQVDGSPGYFAQTLLVYGREGESCMSCGGKIARTVQNQRSTFYCPKCQRS